MLGDISTVGACNFGGATYVNGDEWTPKVAPFGKMNCITCKCKVRIKQERLAISRK